MSTHKLKTTTHHILKLESPELLCVVNILLSEQKRMENQQRVNDTLNTLLTELPTTTALLNLIKSNGQKI